MCKFQVGGFGKRRRKRQVGSTVMQESVSRRTDVQTPAFEGLQPASSTSVSSTFTRKIAFPAPNIINSHVALNLFNRV